MEPWIQTGQKGAIIVAGTALVAAGALAGGAALGITEIGIVTISEIVIVQDAVAGVPFRTLYIGGAIEQMAGTALITLPYVAGTTVVACVAAHPVGAAAIVDGVADSFNAVPPTRLISSAVKILKDVVWPEIEEALE